MNLNMIRPKNETEDLLLSITKNCETLIDQTHRKAETLEFKMIKPKETFHVNPSIQVKEDWMLGLIDLEVYNSIFNITEENNKFELHKFPDEKRGGISYTKVRDEIEKDLDIEDITAADLQDDIIAPIIIEEYNEQVSKRMNDAGYMNTLPRYTSSVFQDFESFLRTQIDLVEDDIKLVLDEYNSSFITCELDPGIYTFKDISEALFNILQSDCPGDCNVTGTKNIIGEITLNKKTGREIKLLVGQCPICNRKKSMIVSDNTIQAEGLGSFFKNLGRISAKAGKKLAANVLKNPGRAL